MNFSARIASIAAFSLLTATSAEAVPAGTLYEAFPTQLFSLDLGALTETGVISARATHLVAAGDHVFWQDDIRIWRANKDLTGVTNIWTNLRAPADISVDPTGTYLFEAFPTQLFTLDLRTLTETAETSVACHAPDRRRRLHLLAGRHPRLARQKRPDRNHQRLDQSACADRHHRRSDRQVSLRGLCHTVVHARPRHPQRNRRHQCRHAGNLTATADHIYWQDDIRIWRARNDLTDITNIWTNLRAPTSIAVGVPPCDDGGPRDAYAAAARRWASGLRSAPSRSEGI
jgi:hypothetical protein